jgi:hypothetical protein
VSTPRADRLRKIIRSMTASPRPLKKRPEPADAFPQASPGGLN